MVLLGLIVAFVVASSIQAQTEEFEMGNQFYEQKDYASAIRMYTSVLSQGYESAPMYFNLGNAYFKTGDLGQAVRYLMKARRLEPADPDINQNLQFASQFSQVQMEGVALNPIYSFFQSIVGSYKLSIMAWISSILFVMFIMLLVARVNWALGFSAVDSGLMVLFIALLLSAGLTTFKYQHDYLTERAVVIAEEAPVYTGPSDQSDIELQGAPGLVVEILSESGEYYDVLFENNRRGWVHKDLVAEI